MGESASFPANFSEIFWAITSGVGTERGSFGCSAGGEEESCSFLGWAGAVVTGREGGRGRASGPVHPGRGEASTSWAPHSRTATSSFPTGPAPEK